MKNKKFINPLTKPTTDPVVENTLTNTFTFTDTSTTKPVESSLDTETYKESGSKKKQKFEEKNERVTIWVNKQLNLAFEKLSKEEETSKTALINEAVADLLKKYGRDM